MEGGNIDTFTVVEPHPDADHWQTHFSLAQSGTALALFCQMRVGRQDSVVAPVRTVARCPKFVRQILQNGTWEAGSTIWRADAAEFIGRSSADELSQVIWDRDRRLPVVVVSEDEGFMLHPQVLEQLAADLAGVALVALIDTEAAWRLTELKGKGWSCFSGAIRLYWPLGEDGANPRSCPYWLPHRLVRDGADSAQASSRIRNKIRAMILEQSSALTPPTLISEIRQEHRTRLIREAKESSDNRGLAELYSDDVDRLEDENTELRDENRELHAKLRAAKVQLAHNQRLSAGERATEEASEPEANLQPESVQEAVSVAKEECAYLIFGPDVDKEASQLAPQAGPPSKILRHLQVLDDLARTKADQGSLGTGEAQWLKSRGLTVSGESETTRNSKAAMKRRTWSDGTSSREFERHVKTTDGTSPDLCVRIYYDWDEEQQKLIIGSVGRHPDEGHAG